MPVPWKFLGMDRKAAVSAFEMPVNFCNMGRPQSSRHAFAACSSSDFCQSCLSKVPMHRSKTWHRNPADSGCSLLHREV